MKKNINGIVSFSGDKSISHRAALFSALIEKRSVFYNFNPNKDCMATLQCLHALGVEWELDGRSLTVNGRHPDNWKAPQQVLDARNSGTSTRLLSGILATRHFSSIIDGDNSLRKRPMGRIIDPLLRMGANIKSNKNKLPLKFSPSKGMTGITYSMPVASAQVKSSLLLAGLFCEDETRIIETIPTRDHTERMLGLSVTEGEEGRVIVVRKGHIIPDLSMDIPGDISSSAFFIAAALLLEGSDLTIEKLSLNPSRSGILEVLKKMGASLEIEETAAVPEPTGRLRVRYSILKNIHLSGNIIPNIIDEIPILAIIATQSSGLFELRDARELRYKESDRIRATVSNLRVLGVEVDEYEDGFALEGPQPLGGGLIHAYEDHRIAMSFAIANLLTEADVRLDSTDCIGVSFPGFYDVLNKVLHAK